MNDRSISHFPVKYKVTRVDQLDSSSSGADSRSSMSKSQKRKMI